MPGGNIAYLSSTQKLSGTMTQALARRSNGFICYQRSWREGGVRCMGAAGVFDRLKYSQSTSNKAAAVFQLSVSSEFISETSR